MRLPEWDGLMAWVGWLEWDAPNLTTHLHLLQAFGDQSSQDACLPHCCPRLSPSPVSLADLIPSHLSDNASSPFAVSSFACLRHHLLILCTLNPTPVELL